MTPKEFSLVLALAALAFTAAVPAHAAPTEEQKCQAGRYAAAGSYARCQTNAFAKQTKLNDPDTFQRNTGKCRDRYRLEQLKLQFRFPGTSCDGPRFVDNGDGTVTDALTGLDWEKKTGTPGASVDCSTTACTDPHEVTNSYQWCLDTAVDFVLCDNAGAPADGGAFTEFLAVLNDSGTGCFAGHCDWRLPTRDELQTIVDESYPCTAGPCVDPILGPTQSGVYWSSTASRGSTVAAVIDLAAGDVGTLPKAYFFTTPPVHARAVRGGGL